jgi:hypothetical protein
MSDGASAELRPLVLELTRSIVAPGVRVFRWTAAAQVPTGKILVGTTSWTEKTLIDFGLFYPPVVKTPEDRLRYYATKFPITEVDSTY